MRLLALASVVCAAQDATLSGIVRNALTNEPIRNAVVILTGSNAKDSPSVLSDSSGKFQLTGVKPGRYRFTAEKPPMLKWEFGQRKPNFSGTPIDLKPGEARTDEIIPLLPSGVVTGRVVDEDGEPAVGAQVQLRRWRYTGSRKQITDLGQTLTDDRGEFRIFGVAPGRYLVAATFHRFNLPARTHVLYLGTYHPSADRADRATWVDIGSGGETRGINIALRPSRSFTVRGIVTADGAPAGNVNVMMYSLGENHSIPGFVRNETGAFQFVGVAPGRYEISSYGTALLGRITIEVTEDLDGVKLPLSRGVQLRGQVRVEGEGGVDLTKAAFGLEPPDSPIRGGRSPVDREGKFSFQPLSPGSYEPSLQGLAGAYLKEIRVSGQPVNTAAVELNGDMDIEVVASLNGGTADGAVTTRDGKPAVNATVVLVPETRALFRRAQFRIVATDRDGRYRIEGIAPGKHSLFAFEEIEQGAWHDPEIMNAAKGESIELAERETKTMALTTNP
jgi:protocatechuate 3,4-dioxygenase beta subunit